MANTTNWLSISSQSGSSGQTILTLSANKNLSAGTKTAEVTAYNPVYNISAKTYVTIDAYSPYIYVSDSIIGIPASGGTYQLGIESNCSFVIAYPNMVSTYSTSAGTGNISVTFSVPATYQSQTITENIVITDESGQYSIVVRLEQYGSEPEISAVPPELLFEANGGTLYFTVSANCVYDIDNSAISGWCGVSPQSGYTGSTTFTVTTTANTGDSAKTGIISVIGPGTAGDMVQVRQKRTTVQIPYTADTSTIEASGETRTITIDTTGLVDSSITVDIQNAPGAIYTYSNGVITVTIPDNSGSTRDVVVSVTGKTTGGDDAATSITFPQAEHTTGPLPYTADTSTIAASGETRTITIDTTGLIASSITIGIEGATGVSYSYNNGVITLTIPENSDYTRNFIVTVSGKTNYGDEKTATIVFVQNGNNQHFENEYLTFIIQSDGEISWKMIYYSSSSPSTGKTISYNKNNTEWVEITSTPITQSTTIPVLAGDIVQFKGDNDEYSNNAFGSNNCQFTVEGNIMSLIDSTGYSTLSTIECAYTFTGLFNYCAGLIDARNLVLPASTLADYCYSYMFSGCTNLTASPSILPATTLANYCYMSMFYNCTSLTAAPVSIGTSSTTLASHCCDLMFQGCTSLTTAPALPATTLANYCYMSMFQNCTSLTTAPALPATTLESSCYRQMFIHCTGLTTAPALPATTLANSCYVNMFSGCTSLTAAPVSIGTSSTTLANSCCAQMFAGCTSLATAPALPATTLTNSCYNGMFSGCASLATAPTLPATTLENYCYGAMFLDCTSLTQAPELPAAALANYCYEFMFCGCTSLNSIKCLATNIPASTCTANWVSGVASAGTFVKDSSMTGWTTGTNGIPSGWTVQDAPGPTPPPPQEQPLTFKITSSGTIYWKASDSAFTRTIQYSKDSGSTWTSISSSKGGAFILVNAGDTVQFRGDNATYSNSSQYNSFSGNTRAKYEVEGNIMSLIDSTNFATTTTLASSYTFSSLFRNCTGLTSAENLKLPATTLASGCYNGMFSGCTSLTTVPSVLPATTLAGSCYQSMFAGCTSLRMAPELPATILAYYCYGSMFQGCTSLTTAPALPATTLENHCYDSMFYGCASLTTAPELPATTLKEYCCNQMFYNCTSLNYIKCLATNISANSCTYNWVKGVASTGIFVKNPNMSSWTRGTYGIPSGWTVQDAT